jgi:hydroxylamine reductase
MFCRQCEQTNEHRACVTQGVCGKTAETSACQDALLSMVKSLAFACQQARAEGWTETEEELLREANVWTLNATFSTLTNVNFSEARIVEYLREGQSIKDRINQRLKQVPDGAKLDLSGLSDVQIEEYGHTVSVPAMASRMNHDDAFCLNELAQYALKGVCAYAAHCHQLGATIDPAILASIHDVYVKIADPAPDVDGLLKTVLRVGEVNAQVLGLLDASHATNFGDPSPSPVRTTAVKGKCILVSGHDLQDLHELLVQTEGKGINVYTHGENASRPRLPQAP